MSAERHRFDIIDQEQLAAQLVAVMDAHLQRPSADEKYHILSLARRQIESEQMRNAPVFYQFYTRPLTPSQ